MLAWFNEYWLFVYLHLDSSPRKSDTGILGSFGNSVCSDTENPDQKPTHWCARATHKNCCLIYFVMWNVLWSFLLSGLRKQEYLFLIMFSSRVFFLLRLSRWVLQAVRHSNSNLNYWDAWCRYVDFVYDLLEMFAWYILGFFAYLQLYFHCWLFTIWVFFYGVSGSSLNFYFLMLPKFQLISEV